MTDLNVFAFDRRQVSPLPTMAMVELYAVLEKIKEDTGAWNKTLATLRAEHQAREAGEASPPKVPQLALGQVA